MSRILIMLQEGKHAYGLKRNMICCGLQDLEMEIKFKIQLSEAIFLVGLKSGSQSSCFSCLSTFLSLVMRRVGEITWEVS